MSGLQENRQPEWLGKLTFLNAAEGLRFCGGDSEFYRELLQAFCMRNLSAELQRSYSEMDLSRYHAAVHGLKCTARSIGAEELWEKAEALERAAKRQDDWFVYVHHDEMFDAYHGVMMGIRGVFVG